MIDGGNSAMRTGTIARLWHLVVVFNALGATPHAPRGRRALNIAIIGVGAIGGYLGTRLAHAGNEVTFIARGANLDALRTRGIRLIMGAGSELAAPHVAATADDRAAGPQDVTVLTTKAHRRAAAARD